MDTRRFRNHPSSEALAQVRWLGWVMIVMFVLVQTATGGTASGERSEQSKPQISPYVQARADFDPQTHQVTVEVNPPAAIWDSTADLGRRSFPVCHPLSFHRVGPPGNPPGQNRLGRGECEPRGGTQVPCRPDPRVCADPV